MKITESVIFLKIIFIGGTSLKVWDPVAGRLLAEVSQHHKTIMCLCFASDGRRLMSGSLDRSDFSYIYIFFHINLILKFIINCLSYKIILLVS